jgi:hypothetical protein
MRTCKRCKTNEVVKGLLNCEKCDKRNRKHTAKMIADSKAKNLHIPVVSKSLVNYGAYGGLGCEWDKGIAGHLENL